MKKLWKWTLGILSFLGSTLIIKVLMNLFNPSDTLGEYEDAVIANPEDYNPIMLDGVYKNK